MILQLLVRDGADVNTQTMNKVIPLNIASDSGHLNIIRLLITRHSRELSPTTTAKPLFAPQQGMVASIFCEAPPSKVLLISRWSDAVGHGI